MSWLSRFLHKSRSESVLDKELHFHLERQIADYLAAGMSAEEARRRARLEFGGLERVKEEVRDTRWETHLDNLFRDLRYAFRCLRKDRRFALIAIFALALGIGSTSTVFSVIYNGLLRPFPYKGASRLATFYIHDMQDATLQEVGRGDRGGFTSAEFLVLREQSQAFEDMIGLMSDEMFYTNDQGTLPLRVALVTPNTFQFLGVNPLLGRSIIPADANPAAPSVFAMNYKLWQKHFNGDAKIVGTSFVIGGVPRTLVAIMPPRFQIGVGGCDNCREGSDIWIPSNPRPSDSGIINAAEPMHLWALLVRLRPGISPQAASSDSYIVAQRLARVFPALYPPKFTMVTQPYVDLVVGNFRAMLYALAAAVAMLLLITCTNVANLLLARATTRDKEMAIRASIGASRSRLVRQVLMESFVLALAGAIAGCVFAYWGLKGFLLVLPNGTLPEESAISLNTAVLLFALSITSITALLCGLVSALHSPRADLLSRLAGSGKGVGGDIQGGNLRAGLLIGEVALSIVLLMGAGLMLRTLFALNHVNMGFDPSHVLVTELSSPNGRQWTVDQKRLLFDRVLGRVKALPGVIAATATASLPPYGGPGSDVEVAGRTGSARWSTQTDLCSDGFFRTVGIQLLRGRLLSEGDMASARQVVVVDDTLARSLFSGVDPVGRKIKFKVLDLIPDAPHNAYFEIIGVVKSIKNRGLRDSAMPQAYLPYTIFGTPGGNVLVRTSGDPLSMIKVVHETIRSVDRGVSLTDTSTLETYLRQYDYAAPEFGLVTLGSFAGIGLLIVTVGIFGVMAYTVSLRVHEIGIRMALGAQQNSILKMILAKGVRMVAVGIIIGLFASYGLTRFLASQIWGVSTTDPWTFAAVAMLAVFAGLAACLLPARRATRVDPLVALRYE
jgi:putative ABC transport system permease protein